MLVSSDCVVIVWFVIGCVVFRLVFVVNIEVVIMILIRIRKIVIGFGKWFLVFLIMLRIELLMFILKFFLNVYF